MKVYFILFFNCAALYGSNYDHKHNIITAHLRFLIWGGVNFCGPGQGDLSKQFLPINLALLLTFRPHYATVAGAL